MEFIKCDFTALNTHYLTLLWSVSISGNRYTYGLKSYVAVYLYQQTVSQYQSTDTHTHTHVT
jgi:hypothetical protein